MAFCPPNPYPDLMVDIETLSTRPNAAILSIAAVPFNYETGTYSEVNFYREIDEKLYGPEFHIDAKTVAWWDKQIQHKPQGTTPPPLRPTRLCCLPNPNTAHLPLGQQPILRPCHSQRSLPFLQHRLTARLLERT